MVRWYVHNLCFLYMVKVIVLVVDGNNNTCKAILKFKILEENLNELNIMLHYMNYNKKDTNSLENL